MKYTVEANKVMGTYRIDIEADSPGEAIIEAKKMIEHEVPGLPPMSLADHLYMFLVKGEVMRKPLIVPKENWDGQQQKA